MNIVQCAPLISTVYITIIYLYARHKSGHFNGNQLCSKAPATKARTGYKLAGT